MSLSKIIYDKKFNKFNAGQYTVREGSTMTLECEANGNPKPVITWKKEGSLLPNGHKFMEGPAVQIGKQTSITHKKVI